MADIVTPAIPNQCEYTVNVLISSDLSTTTYRVMLARISPTMGAATFEMPMTSDQYAAFQQVFNPTASSD